MEESEKREPKYALLVQHLTELIQEISVQEDTCLPSERELCERYGVSRITVRRALSELESAGQIYRVQGKGAFVRSQKLSGKLSSLTSLTEDMQDINISCGSRILVWRRSRRGRRWQKNSALKRIPRWLCSSVCAWQAAAPWR